MSEAAVRIRRRWLVPAVLACALLAIAALLVWHFRPVDEGAMVRDGRALAQIRAQVDGRRACAPLLGGRYRWAERWSAIDARSDSVEALVAAGLLDRRPVGPKPGEYDSYTLSPTARGSRDIVYHVGSPASRDAIPPEPYLCYGRMRVVDIQGRAFYGSAVDPDDGQVTWHLDYRFRVTDMPEWTRRADIRAAFPFLDRVRSAPLQAGERAFVRDRRFTLEGPVEIRWPKDPGLIFDFCNLRPSPRDRQVGGNEVCADVIR